MDPRHASVFRTAHLNADKVPEEGGGAGIGILYSILAHFVIIIVLVILTWILGLRRPETVKVFELVVLEEPKLRPLRPKVKPPPEPPPKPDEPVRPKDPPKLTPTPEKPPEKKKEPKIVREEPDTTKKQVDMTPVYEESQPKVAMQNVDDRRLSIWAGRVKKRAEVLWNPPTGIDILANVMVVVHFRALRGGDVEDIRIGKSSGNAVLDNLALQTIQRMGRVPPIPPNFPDDAIEVGIEFPYHGR